MAHVTTNINNTTNSIYYTSNENGIFIEELAVCNKTAGTITLIIEKTNRANNKSYRILSTTLEQDRAFYKNGGYLNKNWAITITITGGDADIDLNYKEL